LKDEPASGLDCSGNLKAAPDIRQSGPAAGGGYVLPVGQKVKVGRELARIGANAHSADRLSRNSNARPGQTALLIPGPCCRSDIPFGPRAALPVSTPCTRPLPLGFH